MARFFPVWLLLLLTSCASTLDRAIADLRPIGVVVPNRGTSHAAWIPRLTQAAAARAATVTLSPLEGPAGRVRWGVTGRTDEGQVIVVVNSDLPINAQVEALAHELGHVYGPRTTLSPLAEEAFAEGVALLVTHAIGLDTSRATSLAYLTQIEGAADWLTRLTPEIERAAREILQAAQTQKQR